MFFTPHPICEKGENVRSLFHRLTKHRRFPNGQTSEVRFGGVFATEFSRWAASNSLLYSFDRESLTETEIEDIKRQTQNKAHFLPRRMYECYLIEPQAIACVISGLLADNELSGDAVSRWINENAHRYCSRDTPFASESVEWKRFCDAAKLLKALFEELTESKLQYQKTTHSVLLTNWLLTNQPNSLAELTEYVGSLLDSQGD